MFSKVACAIGRRCIVGRRQMNQLIWRVIYGLFSRLLQTHTRILGILLAAGEKHDREEYCWSLVVDAVEGI